MKRFTPWLAGLSMIAAGLALAEAPKIDQARIDVMLKQVQAQMAAQPQQPGAPLPDKAQLTQDLTRELQTVDVLHAEAVKAGLDKQPDIQAGLANLQAQYYANAYVQYLQDKIEVSDSDLRQTYDLLSREIKLLPIEFESEAAAKAGLERLKKGLSFEALMKEVNPQSPTDVWMNPQQLPPPVAHIASLLKDGQITGDVVNLEGHHYLFKLAGARRSADAPPFEQVKEQLRNQARQQKVQAEIAKLLQEKGIQP